MFKLNLSTLKSLSLGNPTKQKMSVKFDVPSQRNCNKNLRAYYIIACAESELLLGAAVPIPNSSTRISISELNWIGVFRCCILLVGCLFIFCIGFGVFWGLVCLGLFWHFLMSSISWRAGVMCVVWINGLGFELKASEVNEKNHLSWDGFAIRPWCPHNWSRRNVRMLYFTVSMQNVVAWLPQ